MNVRDILFSVTTRLDNHSLLLFSQVPELRETISSFADDGYFWKKRVEHLLGRHLKERDPNFDWREVYYKFQHLDVESDKMRKYNIFVSEFLESVDSVSIAIELGYTLPSELLIRMSAEGREDLVRVILDSSTVFSQRTLKLAISVALDSEIALLILNNKQVDSDTRAEIQSAM